MKLLFVKSNKWGSRFIRWGLGSDCSHFAVSFDDMIVFHSVSGGAELEWLGLFKRNYTIVHALKFKAPMPLQDEESIYQGMLAEYSGEGYDFKALLFWLWRGTLLKFFGVPLPPKNQWSVSGYNLCTGLAGGVKWISSWAAENNIDLEMVSPHDLYTKLLDTRYFSDGIPFGTEAPWVEKLTQ